MRTASIYFLVLLGSVVSAGAEKPPALDDYVEHLLDHHRAGELLAVTDEFRDKLRLDQNGELVRRILDHPELRGLLYGNYDAAPDEYSDLVMSRMLSDDAHWTPGGGLYRSPSGGMVVAIMNRYSPDGLEGRMQPEAFPLALENRATRLEIAKVLEDVWEDAGISAPRMIDRRRLAWEQIVRIANSSYHRLTQEGEDKLRTGKSSAVDQGRASHQRTKSRGPSAYRFHDHEVASSSDERATTGQVHPRYVISALALLAIAAATLYRSNARIEKE